MNSDLLPCKTCPWRMDATAAAVPNYVHAKACDLLHTCVGDGDDFRKVMACHYSLKEEEPFACNGYLAQAGWSNINVRILLAQRKIAHPDEVAAACKSAGVKLHRTWAAALRKLTRTRKPAGFADSSTDTKAGSQPLIKPEQGPK